MLNNQSGPRDWTPSDPSPASAPRSRYQPLVSASPAAPRARPRTRPWAPILLSLVFGVGACACAFAPTFESGSRGFILSTVGVTAVVSGVAGWRISRRTATRILAIIGIVLGVVGSAGMLTRAAALWAPGWASAVVAPTTPLTSTTATAVDPAQAANDIITLIELSHRNAGATYPTVMTADANGVIVTPAGSFRLPLGDAFSYIPSSDLSGYRLQVSDADGVVARYDSATKTIATG